MQQKHVKIVAETIRATRETDKIVTTAVKRREVSLAASKLLQCSVLTPIGGTIKRVRRQKNWWKNQLYTSETKETKNVQGGN